MARKKKKVIEGRRWYRYNFFGKAEIKVSEDGTVEDATIANISFAGLGVMLSLSASGFLQGSNYHRPPVETPADWTRMASGPLAAGATDKMPEADWWQAFHNQELTRFVERALAQNHDVRRAVSRVLEGRASVTTAGAGLYPH